MPMGGFLLEDSSNIKRPYLQASKKLFKYDSTTSIKITDSLGSELLTNGSFTRLSKGTFAPGAVSVANNTITLVGHGLTNSDTVEFTNSGGGLPAPLAINTSYFVRDVSGDDFKVSTTATGAAVDITTQGTGTHEVYKHLNGWTFDR